MEMSFWIFVVVQLLCTSETTYMKVLKNELVFEKTFVWFEFFSFGCYFVWLRYSACSHMLEFDIQYLLIALFCLPQYFLLPLPVNNLTYLQHGRGAWRRRRRRRRTRRRGARRRTSARTLPSGLPPRRPRAHP